MSRNQQSPPVAESLPHQHSFDWQLGIAIAWLIGFSLFFYSFTLPNNAPITRGDLWLHLIAPAEQDQDTQAVASGVRFLPQRLPLLAVATFLLAGSWSIGRLLLRIFRFGNEHNEAGRTVLAFGLGLSALSLVTLLLGVCGLLLRPLFVAVICLPLLSELTVTVREWRHPNNHNAKLGTLRNISPLAISAGLAMIPFLILMTLGSLLPSVDFDVKEYHLQGPKEYFLDGQIQFLPHNVYTSFPFLTEMLSLAAMVLYGDWYWGALAGKGVLMCFAPLTALALYSIGNRWFGPAAGIVAALIHLSTPWVYRISIIAYAEGGLSFFVAATLLAIMMAIERMSRGELARNELFIAGLLAGSAMACKYPGLVQVVLPMLLVVSATSFLGRRHDDSTDQPESLSKREGGQGMSQVAMNCGVFLLGVSVTIGPWLIKNAVETGNPVYPLAYSLFGGRDWNEQLNEKWQRGHSTGWETYTLANLAWSVVDVSARNDWLSPLLFALAPLAFYARRPSWRVGLLWLYVGWLFLAWWLLTHRLDRFWVPMIPVVSLLAGIGAAWTSQRIWSLIACCIVVSAVVFNLSFVTTALCGYNEYLADLNASRQWSANFTAPAISYFNEFHKREPVKVLSVGDAEVFDAEFPIVYNTVFDDNIFEAWCKSTNFDGPGQQNKILTSKQIATNFKEEGITHIYVNWREILRYRMSYGYTDFVRPEKFLKLQDEGVLAETLAVPFAYMPADRLSEGERNEIEAHMPSLIRTIRGVDVFVTTQIFPIRGTRVD